MKNQLSANEGRARQSEDQRRSLESKLAQYEQQIKLYEAGKVEQVGGQARACRSQSGQGSSTL